jgi:hypothetical protein
MVYIVPLLLKLQLFSEINEFCLPSKSTFKTENRKFDFKLPLMKSKIARFVIKQHKEKFITNETDILIKSASRSSNYAIRESKALGLTIKSISGKKIIEKLPNGEIKIIRDLKNKQDIGQGLKKGMILCRK